MDSKQTFRLSFFHSSPITCVIWAGLGVLILVQWNGLRSYEKRVVESSKTNFEVANSMAFMCESHNIILVPAISDGSIKEHEIGEWIIRRLAIRPPSKGDNRALKNFIYHLAHTSVLISANRILAGDIEVGKTVLLEINETIPWIQFSPKQEYYTIQELLTTLVDGPIDSCRAQKILEEFQEEYKRLSRKHHGQ